MPGTGASVAFWRYFLIAEVVEMFEASQNKGWYGINEGAEGEALSRFLATQLLLVKHLGQPPFAFLTGNIWMQSDRPDWINVPDPAGNTDWIQVGCNLLFINYLHTQLGFSIPAIVAAGAYNLRLVYRNLTGDNGDPFPFFKHLLDIAFTDNTTITPITNQDNPWPLGSLTFWMEKSTFGKDEVLDSLSPTPQPGFPNAIILVLEGFNWNALINSKFPIPQFSGVALNAEFDIKIQPNKSGTRAEQTNIYVPQRILFPFDISFAMDLTTSWTANSAELDAVIELSLVPGAIFTTSTILDFINGADPYFANVNTDISSSLPNVWWLSQDLRIFTATPESNHTPLAGGPTFTNEDHSTAGAYQFCQDLITYLNNSYGDPSEPNGDPFQYIQPNINSIASVTPRNYNWAIARVRLRGPVSETAKNVKVFFRMWVAHQMIQTSNYPRIPVTSTQPSRISHSGPWYRHHCLRFRSSLRVIAPISVIPPIRSTELRFPAIQLDKASTIELLLFSLPAILNGYISAVIWT